MSTRRLDELREAAGISAADTFTSSRSRAGFALREGALNQTIRLAKLIDKRKGLAPHQVEVRAADARRVAHESLVERCRRNGGLSPKMCIALEMADELDAIIA